MFSKLEFILTETLLSLRRHPGMAFAAIACVTASLFVCGLVGLIVLNARALVDGSIDKVQMVVYFHPETSRSDARAAYEQIRLMENVDPDHTAFVSREQGWQRMQRDRSDLKELIGRNPLPDSVYVKPRQLTESAVLKAELQKMPEVDNVIEDGTISKFLLDSRRGIQQIGWLLGVVLGVLSLVIIHHTIELTIFARRKEIHIMALVGATPITVGFPFVLEGIIYGLIGGGIASGILLLLYQGVAHQVTFLYNAHLFQEPALYQYGFLSVLITGVTLGFFGSLGSIIKYLHNPRSKITNA